MNGGVLGVANTPTTEVASGVWTLPEQRRWQQGAAWPIREFTPIDLFSSGEQGVWYDPSDFSTMFQDSAGTTPVTAVGQPVGKILDKSGRGNHASQSTTTSRPILGQEASGQYYLAFDGADDWLQTGNINFSATDKMSVFAGIRSLSNSTAKTICELSANINTNNVSFYLISSAYAVGDMTYSSKGSTVAAAKLSSFTAPITAVLSGISSISGDTCLLRKDGAQVATDSSDQGTGNYGTYPLYIGRRGGTTLPFTGRIYSLIVRGDLTSSPRLEQTEAWVNSKTGAY